MIRRPKLSTAGRSAKSCDARAENIGERAVAAFVDGGGHRGGVVREPGSRRIGGGAGRRSGRRRRGVHDPPSAPQAKSRIDDGAVACRLHTGAPARPCRWGGGTGNRQRRHVVERGRVRRGRLMRSERASSRGGPGGKVQGPARALGARAFGSCRSGPASRPWPPAWPPPPAGRSARPCGRSGSRRCRRPRWPSGARR